MFTTLYSKRTFVFYILLSYVAVALPKSAFVCLEAFLESSFVASKLAGFAGFAFLVLQAYSGGKPPLHNNSRKTRTCVIS